MFVEKNLLLSLPGKKPPKKPLFQEVKKVQTKFGFCTFSSLKIIESIFTQVLYYYFEAVVLYVSIPVLCYFILVLHNISKGNDSYSYV